jgi:tetratricopeptide (TPR) repeat protein
MLTEGGMGVVGTAAHRQPRLSVVLKFLLSIGTTKPQRLATTRRRLVELGFPLWTIVAAVALSSVVLPGRDAAAQETESSVGDAGRHFRRGVELYGEADYAGALVEFKRAYSTTPSSAALYNVGEAQYQLQDYAGALKTFNRFLTEFGPAESHRAEVEKSVEVLRSRVGHVSVTTDPPGADISVDDQPAGRTPFGESLLVSVGRRRLVASMIGRQSVTRYVEVAAGDVIDVTLSLAAPSVDVAPAPSTAERAAPTSAAPSHSLGAALRTTGWISTGALAAGSIVFGVLALSEQRDLKNARSAFPGSPSTLNHDANLTTTYSVLADSLAAAAIVVGSISLYCTLSAPTFDRNVQASAPSARVTFGLGSAGIDVTF